jgi:hypothetical protein
MSTPDPFTPATYNFPPGTPETVPADFGEAAVQREASASQLTAEEIAEFRALRDEKKARDAAAAEAAAEAAAKRQPDRHHVHLADGSVVDGSTIETHYATEAGGLVPVSGAYPKSEFVSFAPVGG